MSKRTRMLCVLFAAIAALLLVAARNLPHGHEHAQPAAIPAPTSAAGYTALWARLDPTIWGAADVSLSVPMSATRSVWLYGDTFSRSHGMVHSSAITEDGGRLHVSHQGLQLLPDNADGTVYWIEAAHKVDDTHIRVMAEPVRIGVAGSLDFHRVGRLDRTGLLQVDAAGDVTFQRWTGYAAAPHLDERFLTPADGAPYQRKGVLFYGKRTHPEARLADGRTLVTICQNRVHPALRTDGSLDYASYRPMFTEQ